MKGFDLYQLGRCAACLALCVSYIPFWGVLPFWVTCVVVASVFYRLYALRIGARPLRGLYLNMGALLFFALTVFQFGTTIDRLAGSALLASMISLKTAGSKGERDDWEVISLALILLGAGSFFKTGIFWGLYFISATFLFFVFLTSMRSRGKSHLTEFLAKPLRGFAMGVPVAILLFLAYPRLQGALVALSASGARGVTGLSPVLQPGTIARLIPLRRIDFRVFFQGTCGDMAPYYWRVFTLDQYSHGVWRRGVDAQGIAGGDGRRRGLGQGTCVYSVEPVVEESAFIAMNWPVEVVAGDLRLAQDLTVVAKRGAVVGKYALASQKHFPSGLGPGPGHSYRGYLSLPRDENPLAREFARNLCKDLPGAEDVIGKIEDYFATQGFTYTLNPGVMIGQDPLDQFLFGRRAGFCEHYASATAYLLRLCGIPSRVVVGYLGGEPNPLGDYFVVRSSSAHAWVEAYYNGAWHTIDPTSFIPGSMGSRPGDFGPDFGEGAAPSWIRGIFRQGWNLVSLGMDALDHYWNANIMGFDKGRQIRLWTKIGLLKPRAYQRPFLFLVSVAGIMVLIICYFSMFDLLHSSMRPHGIEDHYYRLFVAILKKEGVKIEPWYGPLRVMDAMSGLEPCKKKEASTFLNHYVEAVFGLNGVGGESRSLMVRPLLRLIEKALFP